MVEIFARIVLDRVLAVALGAIGLYLRAVRKLRAVIDESADRPRALIEWQSQRALKRAKEELQIAVVCQGESAEAYRRKCELVRDGGFDDAIPSWQEHHAERHTAMRRALEQYELQERTLRALELLT